MLTSSNVSVLLCCTAEMLLERLLFFFLKDTHEEEKCCFKKIDIHIVLPCLLRSFFPSLLQFRQYHTMIWETVLFSAVKLWMLDAPLVSLFLLSFFVSPDCWKLNFALNCFTSFNASIIYYLAADPLLRITDLDFICCWGFFSQSFSFQVKHFHASERPNSKKKKNQLSFCCLHSSHLSTCRSPTSNKHLSHLLKWASRCVSERIGPQGGTLVVVEGERWWVWFVWRPTWMEKSAF